MQTLTSSLRLDYNRALSREFYSNGRSSREPRASKHSADVIELVQLHPSRRGRKIGNSRDTADEGHTLPSLARVFPYNTDRKISRHLVMKFEHTPVLFCLQVYLHCPKSSTINHLLWVHGEFNFRWKQTSESLHCARMQWKRVIKKGLEQSKFDCSRI